MPAVHVFKRSLDQTISFKGLANGTLPIDTRKVVGMTWTNDGGMVWAPTVTLDMLQNNTEFANLFREYKITGVRITFTPCVSVKDGTPAQIKLMYRWLNQPRVAGINSTYDEWNEIQAKKSRILPMSGKPFSIFFKTKQIHSVIHDEALDDESMTLEYAKYLTTDTPLGRSIPHVGLQMRFDTVDQGFVGVMGDANALFRLRQTVYLKCRGVK